MKKAYRSPIIWAVVVVGILFAIVGQILTALIHSDLKYLFTDLTPAGLGIAAMFTLSAGFNFLGSRFTVRKAFTESAPTWLILGAAFAAIGAIVALIILGIESRFAVPLMYTAVVVVIGAWFAAFFIRGMAPEDSERPKGFLRRKIATVISITTGRRNKSERNNGSHLKMCV